MDVLDTGQNHIGLMAQAGHCLAQFPMEPRQILATKVSQLNGLQVVKDPLNRVEVGRIARQAFQMDASGRPLAQKISDGVSMMGGQAIPDNQQLARDMPQQMAQEADDVWPLEGSILDHDEQLALRGNGTDGRQVVPTQGDLQNRRLSARGIRLDDGRQQIKARFIHKHYRSSLFSGFFSTSSHFSVRQRSIASSSRWVARSTGFWRLPFRRFKSRPTWAGWYLTPNSRWISQATPGCVHTSSRKPKCRAPLASSPGSFSICSSLSFGVGPGAGLLRSASPPPSLARFSHWLTAPSLTPRASAISFCFQLFCFSSQARRRRASRQSPGWVDGFLSIPPFYFNPVSIFS